MIVTSGPAQVIATGSASTFGGHPLVIALSAEELGAADGPGVAIELAFDSDPAMAEVAVVSERTERGWRLRCTNFDDAAGRGSAEPVLVGEVGDHLVFVHFNALRFGRGMDRTVLYSFYRVGKADVGWRDTRGLPEGPA